MVKKRALTFVNHCNTPIFLDIFSRKLVSALPSDVNQYDTLEWEPRSGVPSSNVASEGITKQTKRYDFTRL